MDELIDTVETVEIVDGVRARLTGAPSAIETEAVSDSIVDGGEGVAVCVVGVAPLVGEEMFVGVGVMEVVGEEGDDGVSEGSSAERGDVRGVRTSVRGVGLVNKLAEGCEAVGRMNDVSKLISGPSGTPLEIVLDGARTEDSKDMSVSSAHGEECGETARGIGETLGGSDETVIEGVGTCSGSGEGAEISVGVTDDSVGLEMEREVAEGSDGAEICMDEVDSVMTGEMEVDSTEVGGEIKCPSPPLREESVDAGLLELGRGIASGSTSSEMVGTSDGGEMTLPTSSTGSGSGSTLPGSGSSTSISLSISASSSTSTSSGSSSTILLAFCPQRHSAVPKSVEASLRQTSQVSKSVLASVVHSSAVVKVECTSEGDLAVLNSVGVPSAEWKLSSDGMFGRETNDAVDGVFSPSDGS